MRSVLANWRICKSYLDEPKALVSNEELHSNYGVFLHCTLFALCTGKIGKFGRGLAAFVGEGGGRMFVQLATLAGCDYVNNIRGLGLLSALPIISKFKSVPADRRVTRIILHLQNMGKTVSIFLMFLMKFVENTLRLDWEPAVNCGYHSR